MEQKFYDMVEANPVIAAIKDTHGLEKCCRLKEIKVIFILYGDICSITEIVKKVRQSGKLAIVHVDLIAGLSAKEIAVDFIKQQSGADGIISTHPNVIRRARELGLLTIQRFFMLDSMSFANVLRQSSNADVVDVLPGAITCVISHLVQEVHQPLIASGLLLDKSDVVAALSAGAMAVSTTSERLWSV